MKIPPKLLNLIVLNHRFEDLRPILRLAPHTPVAAFDDFLVGKVPHAC